MGWACGFLTTTNMTRQDFIESIEQSQSGDTIEYVEDNTLMVFTHGEIQGSPWLSCGCWHIGPDGAHHSMWSKSSGSMQRLIDKLFDPEP